MLTKIRFLRHCELYNAGEIAGFSAVLAAKFVQIGVAQYVDPPAPADAPLADPDKEDEEMKAKAKAMDAPPKDKMVDWSKKK